MNEDTVKLLKECNSGCKMAMNSIDQIQQYVGDENLQKVLDHYKDLHAKLKEKSGTMLEEAGERDEKPTMMASAFAWMTTEVKMAIERNHTQIAKIMMNGCNMGIQSIGEYRSKYGGASKEAADLAGDLIHLEEDFSKSMEKYL